MLASLAILAVAGSALAQTLTNPFATVTIPVSADATSTVYVAPTATPSAAATLYNILDQYTTPATLSIMSADGCGDLIYEQLATPTSAVATATITQAPSALYATTPYSSGSYFSNVVSSCNFDTAATTIVCSVTSSVGVPGLTTLEVRRHAAITLTRRQIISFTTSLGTATVALPDSLAAQVATCTLPATTAFDTYDPLAVTTTVVVVPTKRALAWK